jgi:hypothetical protein
VNEPGDDDLAQARQWLKWWKLGRERGHFKPVTVDTRQSLQNLAKALRKLDPAAKERLQWVFGKPVGDVVKAVDVRVAEVKDADGRKNDDICYTSPSST